jgi:hypothetical protein
VSDPKSSIPNDASVGVSLKSYFDEKLASLESRAMTKMDERDRRYDVMFASRDTAIAAALAAQEKAVAAALAAQEKAVAAAAESSEKAITKAETAQAGVNVRGNEFRASLDDYTKLMLPRVEADGRFKELRNLIDTNGILVEELRRFASRGEGTVTASEKARERSSWVIALLVTTGLSLIGMIGTWLFMLMNKK